MSDETIPPSLDEESIDHRWTDEIVCPWCGHKHDCSYEFFDRNDESTEAECGACGRPFSASREFSVDYTTERKEP